MAKAKNDITKNSGSIANLLTKNRDRLWACGNDVRAMRKVALELLDDPSLTDKEAVVKARRIFQTAKDNLFLSCLMTYMTGDKVTI